ncbi:MAG: lipoyl(octanoyl) transferase LipB [Solirubrobacteraceae bacterium]
MASTELLVCELGALDYRSALRLQERLREARALERAPDTLLLLEHSPAVYTRGRRSTPGELSMGEEWYAQRGIEIIDTNRGGKVTYHGPGQLVGYPIVQVQDVVAYVRLLEQSLVDALAEVGLGARARPQDGPAYTGVWVDTRKIASIGVHVSHGVTTHGFAINVQERALPPFGWVVACGLPDVEMTSIETERRRARGSAEHHTGTAPRNEELESHNTPAGEGPVPPQVELVAFGRLAAAALARRLGHQLRQITRDELESLTSPAAAE